MDIISPGMLGIIATVALLLLFMVTLIVRQYRRCPSNRVLVVYGKVAGQRAARCLHGGGTFIIPLLQNYAFLTLEPMTIEIELTSALSKKNIRVNVPSTFTIGISTQPEIMNLVNNITVTYREVDDDQAELPTSTLGLLRQIRDPEVRRGLALTMRMLKAVAQETPQPGGDGAAPAGASENS